MTAKRKIRKYRNVSKNPKKKMPIRAVAQDHFGLSKYYNLDTLKFRSPYNQNYSNLQRQSPARLGLEEIFEEAIEGFLFKSPFSRDDISFFKYGLFMRVNNRIPSSVIHRIKEALIGSKGTLNIIQEQAADALLIRFGNNTKMLDADDVAKGLDRQQVLAQSIYELLEDYGDVYWGLEFETEEVFY